MVVILVIEEHDCRDLLASSNTFIPSTKACVKPQLLCHVNVSGILSAALNAIAKSCTAEPQAAKRGSSQYVFNIRHQWERNETNVRFCSAKKTFLQPDLDLCVLSGKSRLQNFLQFRCRRW